MFSPKLYQPEKSHPKIEKNGPSAAALIAPTLIGHWSQMDRATRYISQKTPTAAQL